MDCGTFDLTILYTTDTTQWCEYLFDIFKDFDIQQNSEDVTEFPSNPHTLRNIKESLVTVVIISPLFLQKCTPKMKDYVSEVVGLICGVDDADMDELMQKLPSSKDWNLVDAVAGTLEIRDMVMKTMHHSNEKRQSSMVEMEDTYLTIPAEEEFLPSDYMDMNPKTGDDGGPENTYFTPSTVGRGSIPQAPEELYEPMMAIPTGKPPPPGSGHVFQPTSEKYVNMNKGKHSPQCSQGLSIHPEKSRCGDAAHLFIFFENPSVSVKAQDQYVVSFKGKLRTSEVVAKQKNPYTLQLELPKDHPAELTDAQVTGPNRALLGTFKFIFTSACNELTTILRDVVDPMNFMCESLGLSPGDANELDNRLYEYLQQLVPASGLGLLVGQIGTGPHAQTEIPTALHFAAKHGLKNICSMLVNSPGALQAMKLKNSQGQTPDMLADKHGHNDLKCFLENFLEVAADETMASDSSNPSSYMFMKKGIGYYNQQELFKQLHAEKSPDYDSPFQIPIPAGRGSLTREETIKKLLEGGQEDIEEYYISMNLDMGTFVRDVDAEEDYDKVDEIMANVLSIPQPTRLPPLPPVDDKPPVPEQARPPMEPRQPPVPAEAESEATEKQLPKKNVQVGGVLNFPPLATGQQHLIEIQNRVKKNEVTVDEAVLLFKNWELLQGSNRLSFSTQAETFKVLKQQKQKKGGLFSKKVGKKGMLTSPVQIGQSVFYYETSPVALKAAALAAVNCSQVLGFLNKPKRKGRVNSDPIICSPYVQQQTASTPAQKPQDRVLQTESSVLNRPSSVTSVDSHGSRDSSYNSAPDEPDQEKHQAYLHQPISHSPKVTRRQASTSQQDRIKRLSALYDQLPHFTNKPTPPMPSRSTKPSPPPASVKGLPKPSPPYSPFKVPVMSQAEDFGGTYIEFDEQTPEDLPGLPPPPPPTETGRSPDPVSFSQGTSYPQATPRQAQNKRPIPKPRNK